MTIAALLAASLDPSLPRAACVALSRVACSLLFSQLLLCRACKARVQIGGFKPVSGFCSEDVHRQLVCLRTIRCKLQFERSSHVSCLDSDQLRPQPLPGGRPKRSITCRSCFCLSCTAGVRASSAMCRACWAEGLLTAKAESCLQLGLHAAEAP